MKKAIKKFHELQLIFVDNELKCEVLYFPHKKFASMTIYTKSGNLEEMFFSDNERDLEKVQSIIDMYTTGE